MTETTACENPNKLAASMAGEMTGRPTPGEDHHATAVPPKTHRTNYDYLGSVPFLLLHLSCGLAFFVDFEWWYPLLALASYYLRMFGITGGYHRYFSHRGYRTSRVGQFALAFLGGTATQKGALWWASHHRHHHKFSDQDDDVHSPTLRGLFWAHIGWILSRDYLQTQWELVNDFARYPELRFLNTHHWIPPLVYALAWYAALGLPGLVWGFLIGTVLLWHGTFLINSMAHVFGRRRFPTTDTSRNSMILSVLTLGEGWHNNHHYYPNTANNGFYWWELDVTYYVIRAMAAVGLVWDLRLPPERVLAEGRAATGEAAVMLAKPVARAGRRDSHPLLSSVSEAVNTISASASQAARDAGHAAEEVVNALQAPQPADDVVH